LEISGCDTVPDFAAALVVPNLAIRGHAAISSSLLRSACREDAPLSWCLRRASVRDDGGSLGIELPFLHLGGGITRAGVHGGGALAGVRGRSRRLLCSSTPSMSPHQPRPALVRPQLLARDDFEFARGGKHIGSSRQGHSSCAARMTAGTDPRRATGGGGSIAAAAHRAEELRPAGGAGTAKVARELGWGRIRTVACRCWSVAAGVSHGTKLLFRRRGRAAGCHGRRT
jgi:hypothetical protein